MPVLASSYRAPRFLRAGHLQTVLPTLLRRVPGPDYRRERMELPDGDFLDLDWAGDGRDRLVVLCHGMEGSSHRAYVRGMARAFLASGWDVLAWNMRGCSGEPNRLPRPYNAGDTKDLEALLLHAAHSYRSVGLVGFSLGGNVVLRYLGERGDSFPVPVVGGVAFSTPCDLAACSEKIRDPQNRLYLTRFMRTLRTKAEEMSRRWPGVVPRFDPGKVRDFHSFDEHFTAPLCGFRNAAHYWASSSSGAVLEKIRVPALLVNAADDPILTVECYPVEAAQTSAFLHLEIPPHGGHVGFMEGRPNGSYWSERRATSFLCAVQEGRKI